MAEAVLASHSGDPTPDRLLEPGVALGLHSAHTMMEATSPAPMTRMLSAGPYLRQAGTRRSAAKSAL